MSERDDSTSRQQPVCFSVLENFSQNIAGPLPLLYEVQRRHGNKPRGNVKVLVLADIIDYVYSSR